MLCVRYGKRKMGRTLSLLLRCLEHSKQDRCINTKDNYNALPEMLEVLYNILWEYRYMVENSA